MKAHGSSRERLLFHLKTKGPQTAARLAQRLGLTAVAARQQLDRLSRERLVDHVEERRPVGRPVRVWRLTREGHGHFPEGYAELAVDLLASMRDTFGPEALDQLVAGRTRTQLRQYKKALANAKSVEERVAALARLRDAEGYMAEWSRHEDGSFTLVENHCPICAAAELCQGLCRGELEVFRKALGAGLRVERDEHVLEGARRCTYRITPRSARGARARRR